MPIITNLTDTEHILDGAITTPKLDALAVTSEKIAAGAIITEKLAANSVTATEIDVAQLSAISADLGTITAGSATFTEAGEVQIHPDANTGIRVLDDGGNTVFEALVGGTDVGDVIWGDVSKVNGYMQWDKSASKLIVSDVESPDYVSGDTGYKLSSSGGLELWTGDIQTNNFTISGRAINNFNSFGYFCGNTWNVFNIIAYGGASVGGWSNRGKVDSGSTTNDSVCAVLGETNFDNNPGFIFKGKLDSDVDSAGTDNGVMRVNLGQGGTDSIGFKVVDGSLYACTATGGSETSIQITGYTLTNKNTYVCQLDSGNECKFWVNGTLEATINTNLPTGISSGICGIYFYAKNTGTRQMIQVYSFACWEDYAVIPSPGGATYHVAG